MILKFTKMHGCGNDYVYINCFEQEINDPQALSIKLSNRHYSIGSDGVILICKSNKADAKMRMFNADGSEGKMCGNGIRCVGKYLFDHNMVKKDDILIETLRGIKKLKAIRISGDEEVTNLCVDMGKANLNAKDVPVNLDQNTIINYPIQICEKKYNITCVSMGNPHCIVFCKNVDDIDIEKIGPMFEKNPIFPNGVNTEFIEIIDDSTLKMRVWERGSGETMACGTGACAAAVAAVENGYCKKNQEIKVKLKGGDLTIKYTDKTVLMTGPAQKSFEGEIEI